MIRRLGKQMSFVVVALMIAAPSDAVAVHPAKSLYTALDLSHCETQETAPAGRKLKCEGLPGYPVFVAAGGPRSFLSVGRDAWSKHAAKQTLRPLNTLFKDHRRRATLEWQFVIRDSKPAPYAMIVRYFTHSGSKRGEVLVVTRVSDEDVCHVAYIDAIANPNAIALARQIADERARQFNCGSEPLRVGASGASPM